jgi:hypothetical protein
MSATLEQVAPPSNGRTSRYGRRKRTTPGPRRTVQVTLLVTEKEHEQLFQKAAQHKNLAAYLRSLAGLPEAPQE